MCGAQPQLAGPHFFLGILAFRENDTAQAEKHLQQAAAIDSTNPQIQLHLGYVYYARGEYVSAIDRFEKTIAVDENNEDAWYHVSKAYSQESRRYFEEVQRKHPDSYYTHLARAHFYEAKASWQDAIEEYRKAGEQQPEPALKARVDWLGLRAAGQDPPFVPAGEDIDGSTVFLHNKPPFSEISALNRKWREIAGAGAPADPMPPRTLYRKAEAYQLLSYMASMWVYANAPDSYRAYQLKGQSLEAAGRTDEAIVEYRKALEKNPQLRSVHFAIGNLYWRNSSFDEALAELQAELKLNPNDADSHYELGDILFTQSKLDEAADHFLTCLRYAPDTVEAHLALERIYSSKGQPDKAVRHLNDAARIAPTEATPHYRLWLLYRKEGKTAEAERERQLFQKLKTASEPRLNHAEK